MKLAGSIPTAPTCQHMDLAPVDCAPSRSTVSEAGVWCMQAPQKSKSEDAAQEPAAMTVQFEHNTRLVSLQDSTPLQMRTLLVAVLLL